MKKRLVPFFLFFLLGALNAFAQTSARVQFVNASADPACASIKLWAFVPASPPTIPVDFWLGDNRLDNIGNNSATPLIDISEFITGTISYPVTLRYRVTVAGASNANTYLADMTVQVNSAGDYHLICHGVAEANDFLPNPDSEPTALALSAVPVGNGSTASTTAIRFFNAITDLGSLDLYADATTSNVASDASYGTHANFSLASQTQQLRIRAHSQTANLYSFEGDLSSLANDTILLLATGFHHADQNPAKTSDNPAVGLTIVRLDGTSTALNTLEGGGGTARKAATLAAQFAIYPNPASQTAHVRIENQAASHLHLIVRDLAGRVVSQEDLGTVNTGTSVFSLDTRRYAPGLYTVTLRQESGGAITQKLSVVK
ncbi:MAG: T9SS type A sorting domain-containing protein [Bacteroidetes bacterium]|nr:T9SS type A sorting domain-containing protein [Bacteroidota bacterium]